MRDEQQSSTNSSNNGSSWKKWAFTGSIRAVLCVFRKIHCKRYAVCIGIKAKDTPSVNSLCVVYFGCCCWVLLYKWLSHKTTYGHRAFWYMQTDSAPTPKHTKYSVDCFASKYIAKFVLVLTKRFTVRKKPPALFVLTLFFLLHFFIFFLSLFLLLRLYALSLLVHKIVYIFCVFTLSAVSSFTAIIHLSVCWRAVQCMDGKESECFTKWNA